ncbi:ABC transporter ATP-binding protein [Oricola sp.]|uniref:ABC transporter ATP-binding protein n=1 Tax=Oricola sp. TaxID=1979950 RepID=UPI0025E4EA01|nr:ABC transporter ATP-binding protein [Oricola sp.]MCI5078134.1 ABC transporter ATP-binding protein [Oricola sp.]
MTDIHIRSLAKSYGSKSIIDCLELDVAEGEFLTLLGPSGCGKTTTLRMIAGLEKPTGGTIRFGDRIVASPDQNVFVAPESRNLGMVFQSYALWPHMTVFDNVAYPLRMRRAAKRDIAQKVQDALRLVGLADYADRSVSMLSGGQQQRVSVARAVSAHPGLLLFDEPLSNLDAKLRASMRTELRALQQRLGITAVYVTHDQLEALAMSDRVLVMNKGEVMQIGTPADIFRQPRNRFVADFVGFENLLTGTVEQYGPDSCAIRMNGGQALKAKGGEPRAVGETVCVALRASRVALTAATSADRAANDFDATIEAVAFLGDTQQFNLSCLGQTVVATVPVAELGRAGLAEARPGDSAVVHLSPDEVIVTAA